METTHCIYKHTNKINEKIYIGQTKMNPWYRWGKEGNGYKTQKIYEDIKKYGWDNFSHEIIEDNLSDIEVDKREDYWIKFYNSYFPNGYNLVDGGGNITQEVRDNMSKSAKESWANASEERREQQRQIMIKINKTIDRSGANNPMYGVHRNGAEAANRRKVQCLETGEIFETVTEASRWCSNGKTSLRSHIAQQIQGNRKSCGKHPITKEPLHWKYVD